MQRVAVCFTGTEKIGSSFKSMKKDLPTISMAWVMPWGVHSNSLEKEKMGNPRRCQNWFDFSKKHFGKSWHFLPSAAETALPPSAPYAKRVLHFVNVTPHARALSQSVAKNNNNNNKPAQQNILNTSNSSSRILNPLLEISCLRQLSYNGKVSTSESFYFCGCFLFCVVTELFCCPSLLNIFYRLRLKRIDFWVWNCLLKLCAFCWVTSVVPFSLVITSVPFEPPPSYTSSSSF